MDIHVSNANSNGPAEQGFQGFVRSNLWMVSQEARRMRRRLPAHLQMDDMYSAGCVGLLAAARHIDPERGAAVAAYTRKKIRGAMLDELRDQDRLSRRTRQAVKTVQRSQAALQAQLQRPPTVGEVAQATGLVVQQVEELLEAHARSCNRAEALEQVQLASAEVTSRPLEQRELGEQLTAAVAGLSPRHQEVLRQHYQCNLTLRQIAQAWGVSQPRVSQIHAAALEALRQRM